MNPQDPREVFEHMWSTGRQFAMLFDSTAPNLQIPQHLVNRGLVKFDLGANLPVPIRGLRVGAEGAYMTLSFSGRPEPVYVPWAAVRAMGFDDGRAPPEAKDLVHTKAPTPGVRKAPRPNHLRLVKG